MLKSRHFEKYVDSQNGDTPLFAVGFAQLRFLRALDQSSLCGAATAPVDLITDKYGEVYKVRGMTQVVWDFVVNCESLGAYLLELNDNKVS